MWPRNVLPSAFKMFLVTFLAVMTLCQPARGQGLELGGGWAHVTGDNGTDGFDVGAAYWFTKRITVAANYDSGWDTSNLGNFAFTQVGAISTKSHLQSVLLGPRIFFSTQWTDEHKLNPFGEAQFGVSHLSQKLTQANEPSISASDSGFSWMLGGGVEYLFSSHWSGRANLDFLRTHLANEGQSRVRLGLGIAYTFGSRKQETASNQAATPIAAPTPSSIGATNAKLLELEQRWADALQRADVPALDAILDDTYIDTDELGRRKDKQAVIAALTSGDLKINSLKLFGMQAHASGTSATVVGGKRQEGSFKGQPVDDSIVFTDSFVMKNGAWKAIASHRSR